MPRQAVAWYWNLINLHRLLDLMELLRINEIFPSIQGESSFAGLPFVLVRTTGCNLRCSWCDTQYAYDQGQDRVLPEVVEEVLGHGIGHVLVTGGEPLDQAATQALLKQLCDQGLTVLLETNGSQDISAVDQRVRIIMDIKCPDSGMSGAVRWENCGLLKAKDEVKFVLASRRDYEFARRTMRDYDLAARCTVLLSSVFSLLEPRLVAKWMLQDRLPARLQLQLHKYIWGPDARGV